MSAYANPYTSPDAINVERQLTRFNNIQRVEHLLVLISFVALCVTGLPQKFFTAGVSEVIVEALGGIDSTRIIHRVFAGIFVLEASFHVLYLGYLLLRGRSPFGMIPTFRDVRDFYERMLYYVGRRPDPPRSDRFDYRQKFEYWGIVWGGALMILTGLILIFPAQATLILPGEFVPAARDAHGGEALLALLVIIIWHLYNAHLSPHVFPFDTSIFTGKISETRMREEHPVELERMLAEENLQESSAGKAG
ncbi:MAG: cytochrome b/b6 domain-containing protein [Bacteroidetes bacterium]|nr:cytochrome b/b6 domain-containing protein [Bacteroidota bacterium]